MSTAPPLDVKVIYTRSSRTRRRTAPAGGAIRSVRLVILGVLNLLVASGLYYGTWWQADPELRIKLIMHTEFAGVDLNAVAGELIPSKATLPGAGTPAATAKAPIVAPTVEGPTAQGILLITAILGWEFLSTVGICAIALSAGALLGRAGERMLRQGVVLLGLLALCVLGLGILTLWTQYGRFVPDQLRMGIGALVVVITLSGLLLKRRAKGLTYLAAVFLILSAGGSVLGLYLVAQCDAIGPQYAQKGFLAIVFGLHSCWGWILLPIASRIRP